MTPTPPPRRWTPAGFRHSLKSKADQESKRTGIPRAELVELHYHRRLLARVFHHAPDRWVLKGGQALLMRWPEARYSTDIDLLHDRDDTDSAVADLCAAAIIDLDDHLKFVHYDTSEQTHVERPTRQVRFRVMIANHQLKIISVDVVASGAQPHGAIRVEPLTPPFDTDCGIWPKVRVFPLEDHLAEKICAMYERYRVGGAPSSRYKDLVDIIVIARREPIDGPVMHTTLQHEIQRRRDRGMVLDMPSTFDVPDPAWAKGYPALAKTVRDLPRDLHTFAAAHELADRFLTPLLADHPPTGAWNPTTGQWH